MMTLEVMVTRAYYKNGPLTASLNIKHLVNSIPTSYILYISHDVNGIMLSEELPTAEKAFSKASTLGCNRNLWQIYPMAKEN